MKRSIRIVNYAVNGSGTGHLTRLCAINRWLRRYAAWADVRAEIYFLTSSEADGLPLRERFAAFKLPSKSVISDAGIDKTTYLALAKQWVWHSLGLLRPDLFIVDTFPRGSFGELINALDLCKKRALVFRPMLEDFARRPDVQALLPLYDLVLVPEREGDARIVVPDAARPRTRFVGPVAVRERVELHTREQARARLGLPGAARVVYVSAGGGGDTGAERHLGRALAALLAADPSLHVVAGAGPLYRGAVPRDPRITWLVNESAAEHAHAFDVAVTAAGYNTFTELMLAGVPTVFVPQRKIADDQAERALRAVRAGAGRMLESEAGDADVVAAVTELLEPSVARKASLAARGLMPKNCARNAAAELLRLCLPASEVDRAEAAVGDALLQHARGLGVGEDTLVELMHVLDGDGGRNSPARELGDLLARSAALLERAQSFGVSEQAVVELGRGLMRRATCSDVPARQAVIGEALEHHVGSAAAASPAEPKQ
ncbi:MAG: UDP-glucosyltransferase [Myxococcales bacterium]|nr:UDP-glucosyltransferase [Myxococcales bacterium]